MQRHEQVLTYRIQRLLHRTVLALRKLGLLLLICCVCCLPEAEASVLRLVPSTPSPLVGEQITVEVRADSAAGLAGFQFNYSFDPIVAEVISVSIANSFDRTVRNLSDNAAGKGLVAAYTTASPVATGSETVLATLTLLTKAPGAAQLSLANQLLGTSSGEEISSLTAPAPAITAGGDTTAPSVTLFTVPTTAGSLTVPINSFSVSDNFGVTGYFVSESPLQPLLSDPGWLVTPQATFTFAAPGSKILYAFVRDEAGNISVAASATVTITLSDTTPPTITSFIMPASASNLTVSMGALQATDDVGVAGYLIQEAPSPPAPDDPGWSSAPPSSYSFAATGLRTLYAFARDAAGNISAPFQALVNITLADTAAPTVTSFTLPSTSTTLSVSIFSFSATDDTGVAAYLLSENSAQPGANDPDWATSPQTGYSFSTAGSRTLYAFARDAAGNISGAASAMVVISLADTSPPVVTSYSLPGTASSLTVPVVLAASDDAGVTGYLLTESPTQPLATDPGWSATPETSFTFAAPGAKVLYAYAKDGSGNISAAVPATVTIFLQDMLPPAITSFVLPSVATSTTVQIISFTASDDSGVTGYMASESANAPLPNDPLWLSIPPAEFTFAGPGARSLYGFARDRGGNVSVPATAGVTITLPDTTPPVVTEFVLPANHSFLTVSVQVFSATDSMAVTGYLLTENPVLPAVADPGWTPTPSGSYTFTSAGNKVLYAYAKDAAGNLSAAASAATTITLADTTAPVVTAFILPASAGLTVPVVSFTATDDIGVAGYLVTESTTPPQQSNPGWMPTPYSSFIFSSAGTRTLYAYAKDAAGNISAPVAATTAITVSDTTLPVITSFDIPGNLTSLTVFVINFSASDETGVTGYLLTETSAIPTLADPAWSPVPWSSFTFRSAGQRTLYAWVKDSAGNISPPASATLVIALDTSSPRVMGTTPAAGDYGVQPGAPIVVNFNEEIAPYSVRSDSFSVRSTYGTPVPGTIAFGATNTVVTFTPTSPLRTLASYTISLTEGITDLSGNPLMPYQWHFLTATGPRDGHFPRDNGNNGVTIADALLALKIAVGALSPTADDLLHADVAPLVNGVPAPDGRIDIGDAVVILRRVVGLTPPW